MDIAVVCNAVRYLEEAAKAAHLLCVQSQIFQGCILRQRGEQRAQALSLERVAFQPGTARDGDSA